jgi:hypothetical protein
MGLRNELALEQPASFCVLSVAGQNQLVALQVYVNGRKAG